MTTHNHGRVSPFGHPRINAHQATPRGLTQPITSFIGLAYPGIHHAPKKQKTQFFTHRQQKIPRTKPQKRKNKQQPFIVAFFIAFASTIQFSHNTPPHTQHPTTCDPKTRATTSKKVLLKFRGDFIEQQPCCSRHPTACHTTKQTKTQTHSSLFH